MITLSTRGTFGGLETLLTGGKRRRAKRLDILRKYGDKCLEALVEATPVRTGVTAASWRYEVETIGNTTRLGFHNDNVQQNMNIALIVDKGHGTPSGTWVEGRNYIEPAIADKIDELIEEMWKEMTAT